MRNIPHVLEGAQDVYFTVSQDYPGPSNILYCVLGPAWSGIIIIIIGTFKFSRRHDCQFINRIKNWNWTAAPHWTLSSRK